MVAKLEQNLLSAAQLTKIAPQKTSVLAPKGMEAGRLNPTAAAIKDYFGEPKDSGELKKLSAVYADPRQRMNFGCFFNSPYNSSRSWFNPTDITQLDTQKILVDAKEPPFGIEQTGQHGTH
ncbi:MAG: hypothetical protein LBE13_13840 [Bacteroidales bacterium]|jgi:hypothetical protein|nr:hypothetical protein [Bacteroidales bacterium]